MIIKPVGYFANEMVSGGGTSRVKMATDARSASRPGGQATLSIDSAAVKSLVAWAMQPSANHLSRVESIKASIRDGSYEADSAQTAQAMLADQA
jgi:anti-sigma28 factor (negative regulator of flagellin synthesis)